MASSARTPRGLPRGLLPAGLRGRQLDVHDAVVRQLESGARIESALHRACDERLAELRNLVRAREYEAAVELVFALEGSRVAFSGTLPSSCLVDRAIVGHADVVAKVASPRNRNDPDARANRTVEVSIRADGADHGRFPALAKSLVSSVRELPVVGAIVDGVFVASESPMRCERDGDDGALSCRLGDETELRYADAFAAAADAEAKSTRRPRAKHGATKKKHPARLADKESSYVVGTKSLLVIPVCPSDSADCDETFNYELIASAHGGSLESYLEKVVALANSFFDESSWGVFQLEATITPIMQIDYLASECGDVSALDYHSGLDAGAYDVMAFTAAESAGYDRDDFDFNLVILPYCWGLGYSGIGWVGYPGSLINLFGDSYDASVSHELGHNFGSNHAAFANNDGSRGAVGWWVENGVGDGTWQEYGNPYSIMGSGDLSSDDISAQYLIEGKIVFDWLDDSYIQEVEPYDDDGTGLCSPCGPYFLQPTDDGTLDDDGSVVGIQIAAQGTNIYLFVEYREAFGGAVLTWSDFALTNGGTGNYGSTLLVDTTSDTDAIDDALLYAGQSFMADFGTDDTPGVRMVNIYVSSDDATGYLKVEIVSSSTMMPTSSPAPTTHVPTLAPTTDDERCGDYSYCCDTMTYGGYSYTKLHVANSPDHFCCSSHCTYTRDDSDYYLQWVEGLGKFYITPASFDSCIVSGSISYSGVLTEAQMSAACWAGWSTPVPSVLDLDDTSGTAPTPAPTPRPITADEPTTRPSLQPTRTPTPKPTQPTSDSPAPTPRPTPRPTPTPTPTPTSAPTVSPKVLGTFSCSGVVLAVALENTDVFSASIASLAGVASSSVSLAISLSSSRRRLLAGALVIDYEIAADSTADALVLTNSLSTVLTEESLSIELTTQAAVAGASVAFSTVSVVEVQTPYSATTLTPTSLPTTAPSGGGKKSSSGNGDSDIIIYVVLAIIVLLLLSVASCMCRRASRRVRVAPTTGTGKSGAPAYAA